jgi:hypothetical protein
MSLAPPETPLLAPPAAPPLPPCPSASPGSPRRLSASLHLLACSCALAACTPSAAPVMRTSGKIMALGGVAGIVGAAFATGATPRAHDMLVGFEIISALGVLSYAYAELTWPPVERIEETPEERFHRWAKILTERASGAAREGRCARVRRLELRVQKYDRVIHDGVFLKDPEILKCLAAPGAPAAPGSPVPGSPASDSPESLPPDAPPSSPPSP